MNECWDYVSRKRVEQIHLARMTSSNSVCKKTMQHEFIRKIPFLKCKIEKV
jgi:hypothetical protein